MNERVQAIVQRAAEHLTGDPAADGAFLADLVLSFVAKGDPDAGEIVSALNDLMRRRSIDEKLLSPEQIADDASDDLHRTVNRAFELLAAGKPALALQAVEPQARSLRTMDELGWCAPSDSVRYFDCNNLVEFLLCARVLAPGQEQRRCPQWVMAPYMAMASSLEELGRYEEAVSWLERVLVWNPAAVRAYFDMAGCYTALGNSAMADRVLDEAHPFLAAPESLASYHYEKGELALSRGNLALACACFRVSKTFFASPNTDERLAYIRDDLGFDPLTVTQTDSVLLFLENDIRGIADEGAIEALKAARSIAYANENRLLAAAISADLVALTLEHQWANLSDLAQEYGMIP